MRYLPPALAATLALLAASGCAPRAAAPADDPPPPKLAVLIYIDQMRGDYLARWRPLFVEGGLKRLCDDGAWYQDCHYPLANTLTGPGHATVAAGCCPEVHGIVANEWFVARRGEEVSCVGDDRYPLVPPQKPKPKQKKPKGVAPTRLRAPVIGDAVKRAGGKVVALSIKDRSAVLPAGQKPDAVYWATDEGQFVTSTFYRDAAHPWVRDFNASRFVERWRNGQWRRLRDDLDYARWSGPDDGPGEGSGTRQGRTFPHPFEGAPGKKDKVEPKDYYTAVNTSPAGNEVLFELARRALKAERLGRGKGPDLLSLSFSSNDLVGHAWGPDSQEVLDITLRTDVMIKELLELLDAQVGEGRYVVVLTADHGVCPLPEAAKPRGKDGGRVESKDFKKAADEYLAGALGGEKRAEGDKSAPGWVASLSGNMLYLDHRKVKAKGHTVAAAAARLAAWAVKQPGIQAALTRAALAAETDDPLVRQWRRSFHPDEAGDVMLVVKPGWYFSGKTGTTHGSPHEYDTHVPLVVYGPGVKAGVRKGRVSPEAAAAVVARALGVAAPAKAAVGVPEGLFVGE